MTRSPNHADPPTDDALFDTAGRRITRKDISRGLVINVIAGSLGMMWFGMAMGMPLTVFMERLGASGVAIGLIVTVQLLAMGMQVPSALLAERLPNRKRYWGTLALIHRLVWFIPVFLPFILRTGPSAGWIMLAVVTVSSLLAHAGAAPWYSWMADLIPEQRRADFWSKRQSVTMAAFLVVVIGSGRILDRFGEQSMVGFAIVFGIAAVLGCLDILVHLKVPEPAPGKVETNETLLTRLKRPFGNPDFIWMTAAFGVWSFSVGMTGSFSIIYLKRAYSASYTDLAAVSVAGSVGALLAGLLWGKLMRYIGNRTFTVLIFSLAPVFGLAWFFLPAGDMTLTLPFHGSMTVSRAVAVMVLVSIPAGGFYWGAGLSQMVLTASVTGKEGRTLAMAVHWTIVGAIGSLGPTVGGIIMDRFATVGGGMTVPGGGPFTFFHVLIVLHLASCWLVALPLILKIRGSDEELPVRAFAGNPLRVAGMIHNLVTLGESASMRARAKAVRELGYRGTPYAVRELIRQLDDPATDVREEAVDALGRIGSPEALDALLEKLADPRSDLSARIARALRRSPDRRAVDPLISALFTDDVETRRESVRTLGVIGDPRAASSLLELIRSSDDERILSASGEALARIGEAAAILDLVPRMQQAVNPVLRASLAVAVADLLTAPGGFYPILIRDQREPGAEAHKLMEKIRSAIRRAGEKDLAPQAEILLHLADATEETWEQAHLQAVPGKLFDLALGMAALRFGMAGGDDAEALLDVIIWRDRRFGIGLAFLNVLREAAVNQGKGSADRVDLLVSLHFLSHWSDTWKETPAPDGADAAAEGG